MSAISKIWPVRVKDGKYTMNAPLNLPNVNEGIRSMSYNSACFNVVTEEGHLLTSKHIDGNAEDWRHPLEFSDFSLTQVESGLCHHVATTIDNQLVSWGKNDNGQLGRGDPKTKKGKRKDVVFSPSLIPFFNKMQIQKVACGNEHTLCLTAVGKVFSWGANDCNQLGLEKTSIVFSSKPHLVERLATLDIGHISAGGKHSFALSTTGQVLRWGSNRYGQLGFENDQDKANSNYGIEWHSSKVETAKSVSCGENHTAFLTMEGRIYTCGLGSSGQLGQQSFKENQFIPQEIEGLRGIPTTEIVCGRDCTIAYVQSTNSVHYFGPQGYSLINLPTEVKDPAFRCGKDLIFVYPRHVEVANQDGVDVNPESELLTLDVVMEMMMDPNKHMDIKINDTLGNALAQATCVNGSFQLKNAERELPDSTHGMDLKTANKFFEKARERTHYMTTETALKALIKSLPQDPLRLTSMRIFLILPCSLYVKESPVYNEDIVTSLSELILGLKEHPMAVLKKWLTTLNPFYFERYVAFFKRCVKKQLKHLKAKNKDQSRVTSAMSSIASCVQVLDMLNKINKSLRHVPIPHKRFYIKNLENTMNVAEDYCSHSQFRFCSYPFLYDSASKDMLLKAQCEEMMANKRIQLKVRRSELTKDTRAFLLRRQKDLRKKLDPIFLGELEYSGEGIRQEFFQKLIESLLSKEFGAIYEETDSKAHWFIVKKDDEKSNLADIHFIGLICGLAMYNGVTLQLEFPALLYKKLLDKPVCIDDLSDFKPTEYDSLKKHILGHQGDGIEELCSQFAEIFSLPAELWQNGADFIRNQNKSEYVDRVTDYLLNSSVKKEFDRFCTGFYAAMPRDLLVSFQPEELQDVLVGNEDYDFDLLEKNTTYGDEYHKDHPTILMFWDVFRGLDLKYKKRFLEFLNGSKRMRASGMKEFKMQILPRYEDIGGDVNEMLPQAATCQKMLLLPRYTKKPSLKEKFLFAVNRVDDPFGTMYLYRNLLC